MMYFLDDNMFHCQLNFPQITNWGMFLVEKVAEFCMVFSRALAEKNKIYCPSVLLNDLFKH